MANTYFFNGNPITHALAESTDREHQTAFKNAHNRSGLWSETDWSEWEEDCILIRWLYQQAEA